MTFSHRQPVQQPLVSIHWKVGERRKHQVVQVCRAATTHGAVVVVAGGGGQQFGGGGQQYGSGEQQHGGGGQQYGGYGGGYGQPAGGGYGQSAMYGRPAQQGQWGMGAQQQSCAFERQAPAQPLAQTQPQAPQKALSRNLTSSGKSSTPISRQCTIRIQGTVHTPCMQGLEFLPCMCHRYCTCDAFCTQYVAPCGA